MTAAHRAVVQALEPLVARDPALEPEVLKNLGVALQRLSPRRIPARRRGWCSTGGAIWPRGPGTIPTAPPSREPSPKPPSPVGSTLQPMALRWGILGVARINRAADPADPGLGAPRLVAIASRDAGRAAEAAKQWGIPRAYGSYEDLLADRDIDVVYIPVAQRPVHATWTIRAAEAGKHVLCEKPLALTVEDVDRIQDAARRGRRRRGRGVHVPPSPPDAPDPRAGGRGYAGHAATRARDRSRSP